MNETNASKVIFLVGRREFLPTGERSEAVRDAIGFNVSSNGHRHNGQGYSKPVSWRTIRRNSFRRLVRWYIDR